MKLFLCLDDDNGMMFFNKRQSKDKLVREKMLEIVGKNKFYMNSYTASQFDEKDLIIENDDFLKVISDLDYAFIEDIDFDLASVSELILFYWNRKYPSSKKFNDSLANFTLISEEDMKGNSHDKITIKRYKRN